MNGIDFIFNILPPSAFRIFFASCLSIYPKESAQSHISKDEIRKQLGERTERKDVQPIQSDDLNCKQTLLTTSSSY